MEIPLTSSELSAFGSLFSGVGTILLALVAFYGVYIWREQATFKDKFDLAIKVIEAVCKAETATFHLESSINYVYSSKNAENVLKNHLPKLGWVIQDLEACEVSVEALFSKEEALQLKNFTTFCKKIEFTTQFFYQSIIDYNHTIESIKASKENLIYSQKHIIELKNKLNNFNVASDNLPKVNSRTFENYNESVNKCSQLENFIAENEEIVKSFKAIIDEKSRHFTWRNSEDSMQRDGSTFSLDVMPLSHTIKQLMRYHLQKNNLNN